MITTNIVSKLWNLCNIIKDDGVTCHQYDTELTYLLLMPRPVKLLFCKTPLLS
ncbi:MAG: hypothetical protein ACU83V_12655 [Gammaproteobacteria bacterium]